MRADLLALTTDDLVTLGNRGIVKRAQSELDSGQFTWELDEAGDTVTFRWSDDVTCTILAGKGLPDARCTCPATTLCRHLIRSVLAYQTGGAKGAGIPASPDEGTSLPGEHPNSRTPEHPEPSEQDTNPSSPTAPPNTEHRTPNTHQWDPGTISDEELERVFKKPVLQRAQRQLEEGQVLDLVRSAKPSVRIHTLAHNLRFLVPGDLRYTHCDCAEANPCGHVPLAVWAFRLLPAKQSSGTISTRKEVHAVPADLLRDVEDALLELCAAGVAGTITTAVDRLRRLESRLREAALIWPAEIVADLVLQLEAYTGHDARFSPAAIAELAGELCVRLDAIRANTGAVPQLFVRGAKSDRIADVASARLIGLGCGAVLRRGGVELSAYLQDNDSGQVVTISRDFTDPPPESGAEPQPFSQLGWTPVLKGVALASLGSGQLLIQGGKRTPSGRFLPGRARFAFNPQSFQWESLRPPVLVEDLTELRLRLETQPPASLQPRRVAARLVVCAVSRASAPLFSEADQTLYVQVEGAGGGEALVALPFVSRASDGMDATLARLRQSPELLRFVAGNVQATGSGLRLTPISLVFGDGKERTMVQPWVERLDTPIESAATAEADALDAGADPIEQFPAALVEVLGEQWLLGLRRADERMLALWRELHQRGAGLGFDRLVRPVERLVTELERKQSTVAWDPQPSARAMLDLAVLARVAAEVSAGS